MGYENPNITLIDGYGNPLSVTVGSTIPAGTSGLLLAGSDGTNARYISVDTSGRPAVTISSGNITIAGSTGNTSVVGIASDNTANSTAKLPVISALAGTAAPTWTSGNMVPLSVDTSGNLRITGSITASNPSVSTSGAAVPTSATYIGGQVQALQSGLTAGNLYPLSLTTGGLLRIDGSNVTQPVQMVDTTSTGALGTLNAAVQIVTAGLNTAGFQLAAGTLIGTIVPEVSFDGGTTWNATYFDTPASGKVSSIVFSSANTATAATIVGVGGSGISRVRVSAYTSGTANITLRATTRTDPSVLFANLQGGVLAPSTAQVGGSVTTTAPTYTTGTLNALSLTTAGALRIDGSAVTQPVQTADVVSTGTLGALNASVQINTSGLNGVGFQLSAGTLIGTIVPEISFDGGTTWSATYFMNLNGTVTTSVVFSSANTAMAMSIVGAGGAGLTRIRVSAYTSGTANVTIRASLRNETTQLLNAIAGNTGAQATDFTSSGTIAALNGTVSVNGQGVYTISISITGTWSATLVFEGQLVDTTWVQVPAYLVNTTLPYQPVFSTTTNGTFLITGGGYLNVRVRASAFTSGTVAVGLDGSLAQQTNFVAQLGTWNTTVTQGTASNLRTQTSSEAATGAAVPANANLAGGTVQALQSGLTTGNIYPLSLTTAGLLRIDGSNVTQPITGTGTAGTPATGVVSVQGVSGGTALPENITQIAGNSVSTAASGVQKVGIVGNAGASVDATIAAGTAPTNGLAVLEQYNTTLPAPTAAQTLSLQSDQAGNLLNFPGLQFKAGAAWTSATSGGTLQYPTGTTTAGQLLGAPAVMVQLDQTTTLTGGAVTFQGTYDNINWVTIPVGQVINPNTFLSLTNPYTFVANTNQSFLILTQGYVAIRANLSTAITGSGTVTPYWATLAFNPVSQVKGTVSPLFNGTTQTLTATVASLTNGSARSSAAVNNTTNLYEDVLIFVTITPNTAGTSATGYVNVFGYGSLDGTNFPESGVGTDAAATLSAPPNLPLLAQLTVNANSGTRANFKYGPFSFCRTFGLDRLPPYWGVVIQNNSGATLAASGQSITYLPVNGQLV
jgi:hypothetical protein